MSVIIAIDPSLNSTGIVVVEYNKNCTPLHYEVICPSALNPIDRLQYNYERFKAIILSYKDIACLSYERQIPQMRYAGNSGHILGLAENIGVLKLAIAQSSHLPLVLSVPPGDIKSHATGNSKSDKDAMIAAVSGRHIKSLRKAIPEASVNDVADAYHLARLSSKLLEENGYEKYVDYRKKI